MHKFTLLIGLGVGYVLGARAGRARYDELHRRFEALRAHPKTQEVVHRVQDRVHDAAAEATTTLKDKAQDLIHRYSDEEVEERPLATVGAPPPASALGVDHIGSSRAVLP